MGVVVEHLPELGDTAREAGIGNELARPDSGQDFLPEHQIAGAPGKAYQQAHELRADASNEVAAGETAGPWFDDPVANRETGEAGDGLGRVFGHRSVTNVITIRRFRRPRLLRGHSVCRPETAPRR